MIGYGIAGLRESLCYSLLYTIPADSDYVHSEILARIPDIVRSASCLIQCQLSEKLMACFSAFYPTYVSVVTLLQSLHFGGLLNHKKR